MRLAPIEHPSSIFVRIAGWFSKRQFGKVVTPLKVIYARNPALLHIAYRINKFLEKSVSVEPSIKFLVMSLVSKLNGCAFCNDIALAQIVKEKLGTEKFFALNDDLDWQTEVFSEKEKAVIDFVKEYFENRKVTNRTFEELRKYFSENQILDIISLNAFEHYFNAFAIPLGFESDGLRQIAEGKA